MGPWLYIVLLGICVLLFAFMRPKEPAAQQAAVVGEIETALEQFALELDDDNKELMASVAGVKRELEAEINKLNGRLDALEKQVRALPRDLPAALSPVPASPVAEQHPAAAQPARPAEPPQAEELAEPDIKTRYSALFDLHNQGKSIEYISKKTGMNKGEVQLIIQLSRQEEKFRA